MTARRGKLHLYVDAEFCLFSEKALAEAGS
jgi:hypothetical protein